MKKFATEWKNKFTSFNLIELTQAYLLKSITKSNINSVICKSGIAS